MQKKCSFFTLIIFFIITGCSTYMPYGNNITYNNYKENRPAPGYVETNDNRINDLGIDVSRLYGNTTELLDAYMLATQSNSNYVAFSNATEGMSEEEEDEYFEKFTYEQQQDIISVKNLGEFQNLQMADRYLVDAVNLQTSALNAANNINSLLKTNPFGTISSSTNMIQQINWTIVTLEFLIKQYTTVQRLELNQIK
jgi:hypothetical protein